MTQDAIESAFADTTVEADPTLKHLKLASLVSTIFGERMRWADWLQGRRARRQTGERVAPGVIRRPTISSDKRLRQLYAGKRGLPFKPTGQL